MKGKQGRGKHALRARLEKEAILLHCMLVLTIRRCVISQHKNLKEGSQEWGGGGAGSTLPLWGLKEETFNMKNISS